MIYSKKYELYTKNTAIQLGIIYPKENRTGSLIIEIAKAIGEKTYGWNNKIVFSLSISDAGKIINFLEKYKLYTNLKKCMYEGKSFKGENIDPNDFELTIDHFVQDKNNKMKKTLKIIKGNRDSLMLSISFIKNMYVIPIQPNDVCVILELIKQSLPLLLNWKNI